MDQGLTRRQPIQAGHGSRRRRRSPRTRSVRVASAPRPPPGKLTDIEHVIFLIQENRSFDHYFGTCRACGLRQQHPRSGLRPGGLPAERLRRQAAAVPPQHARRPAVLPGHHPRVGAAARSWDGARWTTSSDPHRSDGAAAGPRRWATTRSADIPRYYALADDVHAVRQLLLLGARADLPKPPVRDGRQIDPNGENGGPLVATTEILETRA